MINAIHAATAAAAGTGATGTTGTTGTGAASSGSASTSGTAGAAGSVTLGGTDFLTLMLAQLKNQDPTSPVDSNVFLTQLSELSEVQGITQLNTNFSTLSSSLIGNQAMQASSLLGHTALVPSSSAALATAGASVAGAVGVPQTSSDVVVNVKNGSGTVVQQIDLGAQSTGISNFTWDGTTASGAKAAAGDYTFAAQVSGVAAGTSISTYIAGTIQSVTMGAGSTGMMVDVSGQGPVALSNVAQISP